MANKITQRTSKQVFVSKDSPIRALLPATKTTKRWGAMEPYRSGKQTLRPLK